MSTEMPDYLQVTKVQGRPRWRLAYCDLCSDGYRGGKAAAEKWAQEHLTTKHEATK